MTIVNTDGNYAKVQIETPFRISWSDKRMAYWLHVAIEDDNLMSYCKYHWVLFSEDMTSLKMGDVICQGEDYTNWDGNNEFPFTYVANEIEIAVI